MRALCMWLALALASTGWIPSHASWVKVLPITWSETGIQLKASNSTAPLVVIELPLPLKCNNLNHTDVRTWCDARMDIVLKSLEDFCRPSFALTSNSTSPLSRRRRRAASDFDQQYKELNGKINSNYKDISTAYQKLFHVETGQTNVLANISRLDNNQQRLYFDLRTIESKMEDLAQWNDIQNMASIAELIAYFVNFKRDLSDIERAWKNGRPFSVKLSSLFESTIQHDFKELLINDLVPVLPNRCYVESRERTISFEFNSTIKVDSSIHILKANPFTFYELTSPGDSPVGHKLEYVGPSHVIYDSTTDCVLPLNFKSTDDLILLSPSNTSTFSCSSNPNPNAVQKYWRKNCEPSVYYLDSSAIQIQAVNNLYYIYCNGFSIYAYKKLSPCPNHVFSIHQNEFPYITIGTDSGSFEMLTVSNVVSSTMVGKSATLFLSDKINHQLLPNLKTLDIDTFLSSSTCARSGERIVNLVPGTLQPVNEKSDSKSEPVETNNKGMIFTGFGIVCVLIVVFGLAIVHLLKIRVTNEKAYYEAKSRAASDGYGLSRESEDL